MVIALSCPHCGAALRLDDTKAGSFISCPECGQAIPNLSTEARGGATIGSPSPSPGETSDAPSMPWDNVEEPPEDAASQLPWLNRDEAAAPQAPPGAAALGADPRESTAGVSTHEAPAVDRPIEFDFVPGEDPPGIGGAAGIEPAAGTPAAEEPQETGPAPGTFFLETPLSVPALTSTDPHRAGGARGRTGVMTLVIVYASGMILGFLLGKFFAGRPASRSLTGLEVIRDYGVNQDKTRWVDPKAAVPPGQRARIGDTIELGHLAVTALGVERRRINLVRIDPFSKAEERARSADDCLVLRVLLRNTSRDVEFAPLDEMFLRPHDPRRYPNYSYIECGDGTTIPMYELAEYSENNVEGQPFNPIKPGQEMEAIIAANEGSPSRATGRMLWRLHLRAGGPTNQSYSTVVGFEFTPEEIRTGEG